MADRQGPVPSGVTIFLTTQYLEEADQLADRIALLDHGTLIAQGTSEELKRLIPGGHIRLRFTDAGTLASRAVRAPPACRPGRLARPTRRRSPSRFPPTAACRNCAAILARLEDRGLDVAELTVHTPDLDDVFLALTSRDTLRRLIR